MTQTRFVSAALLLAGYLAARPSMMRAAVIIVTNRSGQEVRFTAMPANAKAAEYTLASQDLVPISTASTVTLTFFAGTEPRRYQLDPNSMHYFGDFSGKLDLREIGLSTRATERKVVHDIASPWPNDAIGTVPVKILVDDEEPRARKHWEEQLRKRLATANEILEKHCRIRFDVVAVETWTSDNEATTFDGLLRDFERTVKPEPALLAIGFSSQRCTDPGPAHLGATRMAFHSHLLVREWLPRRDPDRLEVLLHELGHYLGAAHSPEPDSVMRARLGDGRGVARSFRIGFDPLNTLVMYLIGEEIRSRGVKSWREVSAETRRQLIPVYAEIDKVMPSDPVASQFVRLFQAAPASSSSGRLAAPVEETRKVLAALVEAAEKNQRQPDGTRLQGDALTEHYVRTAAGAARAFPAKQATAAFLLAVGIGLDDSDLLRKNPATRELWTALEPDEDRRRRLAALGVPTMRGRHDWAQHFLVSAALTAVTGPKMAEAAGVLKEQMDMRPGGSGFSLADLCADFAGVAFAVHVGTEKVSLAHLAETFTVADYVPDFKGLSDGLTHEAFTKAYGSIGDERFRAEQAALWKRVQVLPPYKK